MGNVVEGIYDQIIKDIEEYKAVQKEQEEFDMEQLIIQLVEDITKDEEEYIYRKEKELFENEIRELDIIRDAHLRGMADGIILTSKIVVAGIGICGVGIGLYNMIRNQ